MDSPLRRTRWSRRVTLAVAGASLLIAVSLASGSVSSQAGSGPRPGRLDAAELATLARSASAASTADRRLRAEGALPVCPEPPLPAPTYPTGTNNQGYGVPFVAALTGAHLVSGYSEWVANHTTWTAGAQTYHLYPWASSASGITGWVSGLISLPGLTGTIQASQIEFCDQGGTACFDATPPAGECIFISLGLGGALPPGAQPNTATTNLPLEPATLSGPATLQPGQSAEYTFTTIERSLHAGIAVTFTGDSSTSGPLSAAGTVYYNGYPYDSYPGQFLQVSNVTIDGQPAGTAPGPQLTVGATYTVNATISNSSTTTVFVNSVGPFGQPVIGSINLPPGKSAPISFTGTAQAGAQDIMIGVGGLAKEPGGLEAYSNGFGAAYYTGGPVPSGLTVSNEQVQVVGGQWVDASLSALGLDVPDTYTGRVTLTNTSSSPITNITGTTAGESCWQFGFCVKYLVQLTPSGTGSLNAVGVNPDGSLAVQGSAASITTIDEYLTPSFFLQTQQLAPTNVTLSTTAGPLPPTAPSPPDPPNSDFRGMQFAPQALHGPFQGASSTVVGNDFQVPAFTGQIASVINAPIGGWNAQGQLNYQGGPIAGQPGWNQFAADAVVVQVGLPVGVPSGFNW